MLKADDRCDRGGSQTAKALLLLRDLLLTGELKPGERVYEHWVVAKLGVSRTPGRAALARLSEEGFLELVERGGYAVRRFTPQDAFDAIEVRGSLEGLAARRAAERGVNGRLVRSMQELLAKIDVIIAKPSLSPEDLASYADLNELFHLEVGRASGGQTIAHQVDRVAATPFAHPSGFVMAQLEQHGARALLQLAQDQHRAVFECMMTGQADRAEAIMREHARVAAGNLQLALENGPGSADREGVRLIQPEVAAAPGGPVRGRGAAGAQLDAMRASYNYVETLNFSRRANIYFFE